MDKDSKYIIYDANHHEWSIPEEKPKLLEWDHLTWFTQMLHSVWDKGCESLIRAAGGQIMSTLTKNWQKSES